MVVYFVLILAKKKLHHERLLLRLSAWWLSVLQMQSLETVKIDALEKVHGDAIYIWNL